MEAPNLPVTPNSSKEETLHYCAQFRLNLPYQSQAGWKKLKPSFKIETGIFATLTHSVTLYVFQDYDEPKLCISISMENPKEQTIAVRGITIKFCGTKKESDGYKMQLRRPPSDLQNLTGDNDCWMLDEWPNGGCGIIMRFDIGSRCIPKVIDEEEDACSPIQPSTGSINMEYYFMNEEFSDFTIICQEKKFPVHRIVLSSRVNYFQAMFTSNMKESQEGKLTMDDISLTSCNEMLRFIYQGRVENLPGCAHELFVLADKLGMTDLQDLCEQDLLQNLSVDNAVEVYGLSPALSKKAKEIILSNKSKFAADPETLKNFTCKYPELVFELFQMS